jgi:hypothetical protein
MIIRKGWVSPNRTMGKHWSSNWRHKKRIAEEIQANWIMIKDRNSLVVSEPIRRAVKLTHIQRRGSLPDPDNLAGGMKFLIDELRPKGIGVIWEDDHDHLDLEVYCQKKGSIWPEGTHYVVVEIFDALPE